MEGLAFLVFFLMTLEMYIIEPRLHEAFLTQKTRVFIFPRVRRQVEVSENCNASYYDCL